jgi:8-oxo-dGTP diphosphatase
MNVLLTKLKLAGCVIENNKGEILLLHRDTPKRKQWELPGGKIEPGESANLAAKREIKEELGIEVEIQSEIGKGNFYEDEHDMEYIWYKAIILSGNPCPLEDKHDKISYFSWKELKNMEDLSLNTRNLVNFHFSD